MPLLLVIVVVVCRGDGGMVGVYSLFLFSFFSQHLYFLWGFSFHNLSTAWYPLPFVCSFISHLTWTIGT